MPQTFDWKRETQVKRIRQLLLVSISLADCIAAAAAVPVDGNGHAVDYGRFCERTGQSAFHSPGMAVGTSSSMDKIMPKVLEIAVPEILVAILVVLVLSASMSTLTSLVLTSSSTITLDVLADNVIKKMDEKKKVSIIRLLLAFFVLVSMALAIYSYRSNDMYITKLMSISWGAMAGSFLAPFLYGLFWKGVTKAAVWASFISGVGITVSHLILSNGPLFGHSFKFPTGLPINLASPINAGAFAMLFGLIVVPVVSWISPKLDKKVIDAAFKDMPDDIPARIDDIKA